MGSMVDFASLAYRDAGKGVGRAAISGSDATRMAAEAIRLAAGAVLTERVAAGSDLYLYALTGSVEITFKGAVHALAQDSFATLEEGAEFSVANRANSPATLICVVAPPKGAGGAGFRGGISVIPRASAPIADIPDQKKRRLYFVDDAAARSERAHAMIVEYHGGHRDGHAPSPQCRQHVRSAHRHGALHVQRQGPHRQSRAGDGVSRGRPSRLRVEEGKVSFLEFHIPGKVRDGEVISLTSMRTDCAAAAPGVDDTCAFGAAT